MTYKARFQNAGAAQHYDEAVYARGSHDSHLNVIEERILMQVVRQVSAGGRFRYMDFACGTGRILSIVAPHAEIAVGVDVSGDMLERAKRRVPFATTRRHDLLATRVVDEAPFDLITAFRFFLNLEPASRDDYFKALAANLASRASLLVFNIHGNRDSIRHLARYRYRRVPAPMNEMSSRDVETALDRAGLEVVQRWGVGVLPRSLYTTSMAPVAGAVDRLLFSSGVFEGMSQNLIYACRRRFA